MRKIEVADLELLAHWSSSQDAHGAHLTADGVSLGEWQERMENGFLWNMESKTYIIASREGDVAIGTIHYWTLQGAPSVACVALKIASTNQRSKGYGTEAQCALIRHLFSLGTYDEVEMHTDIDNVPQQRCLAKLGFELVSSGPFHDHGVPRMGNLYSLQRAVYESHPAYLYYDE